MTLQFLPSQLKRRVVTSPSAARIECHKVTPGGAELLLLLVCAAAPRIIGAIWLPNAFGDAYAYTEQIYYMQRAILAGTFSWSNLFGFWLPLYQVTCAGISALFGHPFYTPKLVSAVAGAGVCLLVFILTLELTQNRRLSLICFAIVALNPYHILYSSSAMTDVPHAFTILMCVYCCIQQRWFLASVFGLFAGLMRIESWTLIALIPILQLLRDRKFGIFPILTLLAGPLLWLYVSWIAGGSPWRYFEIRNDYIVQTMSANPSLGVFTPGRLGADLVRLVYTCNLAIMAACCGCLLLNRNRRNLIKTLDFSPSPAAIILLLFFAHLVFLFLAYFTGNQPEIWPRYGLIFFVLGLPILASYFSRLPATRFRFSFPAVVMSFGLQFCIQLVDVTRITLKNDPNQLAAEFLGDQRLADSALKIYCEDGAIRVLSGIPLEEFIDQYNSPADTEAFLKSLKDQGVRFLVYKNLPDSRLDKLMKKIRAGRSGITLEEVVPRPRKKSKETIVVYRVHGNEVAAKHPRSSNQR